ncbi:GIY-YIG nuclease family protein [Mesotoga infera]|nr:GIY-YIG nuclease family protein [Mesotoga infera]
MTNPYRTVFYIGVTNNLFRRVQEHKNKTVEGFTNTQLMHFDLT